MDIVIVAAARTPIGNFNGAFAAVPAHQLGEADLLQLRGVGASNPLISLTSIGGGRESVVV